MINLINHLIESFVIAYRALKANPVRTSLAVLGIVIGISAVIIVYSAGEGIRSLLLGQIEGFGTNIIETEARVPKKGTKQNTTAGGMESGMAMAQGVQVTTLTLKDMEDINKLSNISAGYSGILGQEQVSYQGDARKAILFGVSAGYLDIDRGEIDQGNFFTDAEDKALAQVVVLGSKIKEKLFGDQNAIGEQVQIRKSKFRVVGVMKERGAMGGLSFDDYIYVPIRTLQKRIQGIDYVLYMVHELRDISLQDETAEEIRALVRENHDITDPERDDFAVTTMKEMLSMLDTITGALTLLLLAIVIISLIVGGVGVMNIMYVVVTERTREIGLRKAVGAREHDILLQFLSEAIIVALLGGVIGTVFGSVAAYLIAIAAAGSGFDWEFSIPLKAFFVSIGFAAIFGVFFGVYPARKAARLDPIVALRNE